MLSLDALSMWGCVAAVGCMCHTQWVAGRSCPRLPWGGQCANHRAPRPQRNHQQPTAGDAQHCTPPSSGLLTTNHTQAQVKNYNARTANVKRHAARLNRLRRMTGDITPCSTKAASSISGNKDTNNTRAYPKLQVSSMP